MPHFVTQRSLALRIFAAAVLALLALFSPQPAAAGPVDATRISLPKGPGSVEGLGRSFVPSLASGTAAYGVDIVVPPGVGGFVPKIGFDYDSGGGVSELGMGWKLGGVPSIRRRTESGLPRFDPTDRFELTGLGQPCDLLEVSPGVFRPELESGAFLRISRSADGSTWEARTKNGVSYHFGGADYAEEESNNVATYLLSAQSDLLGHSIRYEWETASGYALLSRVTYNNFSPEARAEIAFHYEARPDAHVLFSSGIRRELTQRLSSVEVTMGGALVRRYLLNYVARSSHSRLTSVQMLGTDGVTALPTLRFSYTEPSFASASEGGAPLTVMASPPGRSPAEANTALADLNGDALPDLLIAEAGKYRSQINLDGLSWAAAEDWAVENSPSLSLGAKDVQLADVDGDGNLDLLAKSGVDSLRYFPGLSTTQFGEPVHLSTVPNVGFEDPDVRLADMDGDRRVDVVATSAFGLSIGYSQEGKDFSLPERAPEIDANQPLRFSDGQTSLCDINGDRVQDFCHLRSGALSFWLGRGRGHFAPAQQASGVPSFEATSPWRILDLDGDGWADLLHLGLTEVEYALAEGAGRFGAVRTITGVPERTPQTALELVDINGTGTTDLVWIETLSPIKTAWQYLELFPQGRGGLLKTIDNGLGKVVSIEYAPAARWVAQARAAGKPWTTKITVGMPVVQRVTVDAGFGDPLLVSEYDYRDGTWDPRERTFAGFQGGTERALGDETTPTLITESTFDPGIAHRTLRGKVLSTEQKNESGNTFSRSRSTYKTRTLANAISGRGIEYSYRDSETVTQLEGQAESAAKTVLTEWEEDDHGNEIRVAKWGLVEGDNRLAGHDESIIQRTFSLSESEGLFGFSATEELLGADGQRVSFERRYYDGEAFQGLPLGSVSRGLVSRVEAWVGPATDAFEIATSSRYDEQGNPVEIRDGAGQRRRFEWEPRSHAFVVAEVVDTGTKELRQEADYNLGLGVLTQSRDFGGNPTLYAYDPLGRLQSIARPGDTLALPTVAYEYHLGAPLSSVWTTKRRWSGKDDFERTVSLFDGLGRRRGTLLEDSAERWALSDVTPLDARGNPRRNIEARYVAQRAWDESELRKDGPGVRLWRDALGREIRSQTALGIVTQTVYHPFEKQSWDGAQSDPGSKTEHTPTIAVSDGLGRTVGTTRTLLGQPVSDRAVYDAAGHLLSRVAADGTEASYSYDGRGRRVRVKDPDAGEHRFTFDPAGNLLAHQYPDGKRARFTFDGAGRVLTEDWDDDGTPEVTRSFDDPKTNSLGLVARVSDPSGTLETRYDLRGRIREQRRQIGGKEYVTGQHYNNLDHPTLHIYPDGSSVAMAYGQRGLLASLGDGLASFTYEADGRVATRNYGTGVSESFAYDADHRLIEHRALGKGGETVQRLGWHYDGAANIVGIDDLRPGVPGEKSRNAEYGLDNLYRLVRAKGAWGETSWQYNLAGNITARSSTDPSQEMGRLDYGGAGAGPHALTGHRERALQYDPRGRLLGDGERTYFWNAADHLVGVKSKTGFSVTSTYDADGRRRSREETGLDGKTMRAEFIDDWSEVADGKLVRYVVHHGQRLVRLGDVKKASGSGGEKAARRADSPAQFQILFASFDRILMGLAVALALAFSRSKRWASAAMASRSFLALLLVLGASAGGCGDSTGSSATTNTGIGGSSSTRLPSSPTTLAEVLGDLNATGEPEPGSVLALTEEDELLFVDGLGSITQVTDGAGKARGEFAALPYGTARVDDIRESRRFAGGTRDPGVGLDLFGARHYAADLGQWISVDPMLIESPERLVGEHPSHTAYAYANSNPVARIDPDGHHPAVALGLAAAAFVGVMLAAEYSNAPTKDQSGYSHEGLGGIALQSAENFVAILAVANAPRAIGCLTGVAMTGTMTTVVGTGATLVAATVMRDSARTTANHYDPSGVAARVIDVLADLASLKVSCFPAGTPVVMCDGTTKAIDAIVAGDQVVSRDDATGVTDCRAVESTVAHDGAVIIQLHFAEENGEKTAIETTREHPFWVKGAGWVLAGDLALGAELVSVSGVRVWLVGQSQLEARQRVFNLHVDQFHSYFVGGSDAVWVHNGWLSCFGEASGPSAPIIVQHPSERTAARAALREAGILAGTPPSRTVPSKPGSQAPMGPPGTRAEWNPVSDANVGVHHDEYGHVFSDGSTIAPHYGVDAADGSTVHHTYPTTHDPSLNR